MVDGLIVTASRNGPGETMQKLMAAVTEKGLVLLAHVDHAGAAAKAGLELRPTDLLIFGNAKGGTPLMQAIQTMGIDLPLKALVWQDGEGKTWLGYNDPGWLADLITSTLTLTLDERQSLLEMADPVERLRQVTQLLGRELNMLELRDEISSQVQQEMDREQREVYLREQMRVEMFARGQ